MVGSWAGRRVKVSRSWCFAIELVGQLRSGLGRHGVGQFGVRALRVVVWLRALSVVGMGERFRVGS